MWVLAFVVAPAMVVTGLLRDNEVLWRWGALVGLVAAVAMLVAGPRRRTRPQGGGGRR